MHLCSMVIKKKKKSPVCRQRINIEYCYIPKSAEDSREIICDLPKVKEVENMWQGWEWNPQHLGSRADLTSVFLNKFWKL